MTRQDPAWKQSRMLTLLWLGVSREATAAQLSVSLKTIDQWIAAHRARELSKGSGS